MSVCNRTLTTALLPEVVVKGIENEEVKDNGMCAIANLLLNSVIGAATAWKKRDFKKLDPNPGDAGCQERAILIYGMANDQQLREELSQLLNLAEKTKKLITGRNSSNGGKRNSEKSTGVFFKTCFEPFTISQKVEFLLQCYLLAVLRAPYRTTEEGIVLTHTDSGYLGKLSKQINSKVDRNFRLKIPESVQSSLSALSTELLREEAAKVTLLGEKERKRMVKMLSKEMTPILNLGKGDYEPKTFGCLFYEFKAILARLKEQRGVICFKSIVKKGEKPFVLFFQPEKEKEEFSLVKAPENKETPVVVFEGVTTLEKEALASWLLSKGFSEVMLACAAIEPPYQANSDLSDLKKKWAQEEVGLYRKIYQGEIGTKLKLDHVYCNSVKGEE